MTTDSDSQNSTGKIDLKIYTRDQHNISRQHISENALKVLYRLQKSGYDAYLVGGGVRDLLLGQSPKDFDIATNATPEQIKDLFRNCRLIGRRFRLAHIIFGRDIIEVATFRGHHQQPEKQTSIQSDQGMLLRDNVYGSIDEDAERRDFTINAMYYNIADFSIHDYANGFKDLERGMVRMIGDPETRYREDPVRMLRAIRFASKLDMDISYDTAEPINHLASLLESIPSARLYEEVLKLLQSGHGLDTYDLLREFGLFQHLFPQVTEFFTEEEESKTERMIEQVLESTDQRIAEGKRVNPAFIFAAILWYPVEAYAERLVEQQGMAYYDAMMTAGNHVLDEQVKSTAIPRRHTATIREVWQLQSRLDRRSGKRAFRLLELNKFRAGFDFLEMRGNVEQGEIQQLAKWWHTFQHSGRNMRQAMVNDLASPSKGGNKRRRSSSNRKRTKKPSQ
ncbi:polynucleotide adenylyltransferase PcnB [Vibrio gallicus]|uniref:polynucleotide adenylyltransferase PcnB n=1 Tax=Vibrio gallicus TaxID=190897 RepID=UPI0021C2619D|nr:polynucleotide adenylyltransferase PcnB [Vibrio gallicus]